MPLSEPTKSRWGCRDQSHCNCRYCSCRSIGAVVWDLVGVWRLPKWQVNRLALQINDPTARADVEDNFRKTVGQALGGAAVLIGAAFALFQFLQQQKAAQEQQQMAQNQFSQQQKAAHDLLISNQV